MTKTFTLSKDRADISATNGQQTRWAPGPNDTLVVTSTFPRLTPLSVELIFERRSKPIEEDDEARSPSIYRRKSMRMRS